MCECYFSTDTATTEMYTYGPLFPVTTLFRSLRLQHFGGNDRNGQRHVEHLRVAKAARLHRVGAEAVGAVAGDDDFAIIALLARLGRRSEEHTSELQSLMRISYAVFCLKRNNTCITQINIHIN